MGIYIRPRREIDHILLNCGRVEGESRVMQIGFEPFNDLSILIVNRLANNCFISMNTIVLNKTAKVKSQPGKFCHNIILLLAMPKAILSSL